GRKSAIGLLYEMTSLSGAAVGVAAASDAPGTGAVDPPQARTIERSVGTRERRITRPPLERAHPSATGPSAVVAPADALSSLRVPLSESAIPAISRDRVRS